MAAEGVSSGHASNSVEQPDSLEEHTKRLSRRLSDYEAASIETEGRANQLRKERDGERILNQRLRKEIDKLSNQLLHERVKVAKLVREVNELRSKENKELIENGTTRNPIIEDKVDSKPLLLDGKHDLTLQITELKESLDKRIEQYKEYLDEYNDPQNNMAVDTRNKLVVLSNVHQGLVDYLVCEDSGENAHARLGTEKFTGTLNTLVKSLQKAGDEKKEKCDGKGKQKSSAFIKFLVFIAPILLGLLCYVAFTTIKQ